MINYAEICALWLNLKRERALHSDVAAERTLADFITERKARLDEITRYGHGHPHHDPFTPKAKDCVVCKRIAELEVQS